MAEISGLVIGAVALVPLIKNVRQIYDSVKDGPGVCQRYRMSMTRLLDTLEVMQSTFNKYDDCLEKIYLASSFEGYLSDINASCLKLSKLLTKNMGAKGGKIEIPRRVLWSLGLDDKAKELMATIERDAVSLHILYQTIVSAMRYDGPVDQANISANALLTPGQDVASILVEFATMKPKIEEILTYTALIARKVDNDTTVVTGSSLPQVVAPPEQFPENDASTCERTTNIAIYRRRKLQPIRTTTSSCIFRKGGLQATLLKTDWVGGQSGITVRSNHEMQVKLYSRSLGFTLHINLGLDMGSRNLYPIVGLYCQRTIPADHPQYQYVAQFRLEDFREVVRQRRGSVHDLYQYIYHGSLTQLYSVVELLCRPEAWGIPDEDSINYEDRRIVVRNFLEFLLVEGYKLRP
ncbi:hypothetical protein TWF281_003587 [Arthrobotrys megalospora]